MMLPSNDSTIEVISKGKKNYPQLNAAVFIVGNCFKSGAIAMFAAAGCMAAKSVEEADLVCFLGGEDVDPGLYGEKAHPRTYTNKQRDEDEIEIFVRCQELQKPMFGICRGMQFLHVMNGGKLFQDVDNHANGPHEIIDTETKEKLMASSMHHQMCISDGTQLIIAYANNLSRTYRGPNSTMTSEAGYREMEAAYYPMINAFCVQGHPEVASAQTEDFTAWCLQKVERLLYDEERPELPHFVYTSARKGN